MGPVDTSGFRTQITALYGLSAGPVDLNPKPEAGDRNEAGETGLRPTGPAVSTEEIERLMHAAAARIGTLVSGAEIRSLRNHISAEYEDVRKALSEVRKLAEHATAAMNAVRTLKARQVVAAYGEHPTEADQSNRDRIQDLFDTLAEVSDRMREVFNTLPRDFPDVERNALLDLIVKNDMRHSEFLSFVMQATEVAEEMSKADAEGTGGLSDWRQQMMDGSFGELTRGMAAGMHGNLEAVRREAEADGSQTRASLVRLDTATQKLSGGSDGAVKETSDEFRRMAGAVAGLNARSQGLYGGFMSAFADHLNEIGNRLDARTSAIRHVADEIVGNSPVLRILNNQDWMRRIEKDAPDLANFIGRFKPLTGILEDFAKGRIDRADIAKKYEQFLGKLRESYDEETLAGDEWCDAMKALQALRGSHDLDFEFRDACAKLVTSCQAASPKGYFQPDAGSLLMEMHVPMHVFDVGIDRIEAIIDKSKEGVTLGLDDVKTMIKGDLSVADSVEMRLNGAQPGSVEPVLCDDNLVGEKVLGSGVVSTAVKLTYGQKDGSLKDVVFKPEQTGTEGLRFLTVGGTTAYGKRERMMSLNAAACKMAGTLGCGTLVPKVRPIVHKGRFGMAMDLAEGIEMFEFAGKESSPGGITMAQVCASLKSQDPAARKLALQAAGELLQKVTDLSWLDLLCGQGDRHRGNYLVQVDGATGSASVTAIDNDMSFPRYRTGLTRFSLDGGSVRAFEDQFKGQLRNGPLPGVKRKEDGTLEVDVALAPYDVVAWLQSHKGLNSFGQLPAVMSESMYNRLKDLDDRQIAGIKADLLGQMPEPNAQATADRLKELRAAAKSYKASGKVVADGDWMNRDVRDRIRDNTAKNDWLASEGNDSSDVIHERVDSASSDYCRRDLFDMLTYDQEPGNG